MVTEKSDAHLRTEKAMSKALKLIPTGEAYIEHGIGDRRWWEVLVFATDPLDHVIAVFDIRDCVRKRAPLKGITKAIRKAIAPKGKK